MKKKHASRSLVLICALNIMAPPCDASGIAIPEKYDLVYKAGLQPAASKLERVDYMALLPFMGEIARALALPVTNPVILKILHTIEFVTDSLDACSSAMLAISNRREPHNGNPFGNVAEDQFNLFSRGLSGLYAWASLPEIKTAAQLAWHSGNMARYKKNLTPQERKFLGKTRNRRLKELLFKRLPILFAAAFITSRAEASAEGGGIVHRDQILFRFLVALGYSLFNIRRHEYGFEDTLLKRMYAAKRNGALTAEEKKTPPANQPDWQKQIDNVMKELGKKK
ncbi:MAG: hypothetical protein PVJ92_00365 [Candidatus Dependentiae bacterium]|jgi:hypothetical protein